MLYPLSYECLGFPGFCAPLALREQQYMDLGGTRNPLGEPPLTCGNGQNEDHSTVIGGGVEEGRAAGPGVLRAGTGPERTEAPVHEDRGFARCGGGGI
ncbi:hypothetical protein SSAG_03768 [Streptomyces sp. Mg1]|nr:hypothetical protein SSAG_03768 [Streptomyces sp. Mg1]